jgi:UDP-2-acetamido-3-amino-2,3-dideoxy-glucuronate N-acetyltransferase
MIKIHPTADVQTASIGENTAIWQFSIILSKAVIGANCNINSYCFIENDVIIGNNVTVKCGVYLWDGILLEDYVMIGPNVTFTNDLYPRSKQPFVVLKTIIKKGASLGANATILGGITIGEYALIGAGSVVTKNVPGNTLWVGNPASQKGFICNCGNKLNKNLVCSRCNAQFKLSNASLIMI